MVLRKGRINALALLLTVPMLGARAETITVRADEWYPVNGVPEAPRPGFAIEILDRIWAAHGYQLDYRIAPWQESLDLARDGAIDCVVGAYVSDAPDLVFPDEHLIVDELAFYVRAGESWRYQGPDSLSGVNVAIIEAYSYGERLNDWFASHENDPSVTVTSGNNALEENIRALLGGQVRTLVDSKLVMSAKIEEMELGGRVESAGSVQERHPVFVACSPEKESSEAYLQVFDQGMREIRESGELGEILQRYNIPSSFSAE